MNMMKDRNLMSHTYDQEVSREVFIRIKNEYAPLLRTLLAELTRKIV